MTTLTHVNTQHANLPTKAESTKFEAIVKEFGGTLDGCSDKGVFVAFPDSSRVSAFTKRIHSTFQNVWVDVVPE